MALSPDTVKAYFEPLAKNYGKRSERGAWSYLRKIEVKTVEHALGDLQGARAIDLGCGAGYYTKLLAKGNVLELVAVDFTPGMNAVAAMDKVENICADATKMSLGRRFNRLVAAGILEFIPEPVELLKNARRHADDGAVLILLIPRKSLLAKGYQIFHMSHGLNVHIFSPKTIRDLAAKAGWRVDALCRAGLFSMVVRLIAQ